jgi:hypothetical protein
VRLLVAAAVLAGCRHLPPDKAARAVAPAPAPGRVPAAEEIRGAWFASAIRGALGELGQAAVYVFGPDGRYSGALVGPSECVPVAGVYAYDAGRLVLDGGELEFEATLKDGRLELHSPASYLELVPVLATSDTPRTVGEDWVETSAPPVR